MENYFQAEAFNLDKVLDEFEQNEGELASPVLPPAPLGRTLDRQRHKENDFLGLWLEAPTSKSHNLPLPE